MDDPSTKAIVYLMILDGVSLVLIFVLHPIKSNRSLSFRSRDVAGLLQTFFIKAFMMPMLPCMLIIDSGRIGTLWSWLIIAVYAVAWGLVALIFE